MPEKSPTNRSNNALLSKVWNIGIAIVLLTLLGHWLDQKFHSPAVFTLTGAILGILYSLYQAWDAIK